jgi:hypothetical protein
MVTRKTARNFKGKIELMKTTTIEKLESLFLELYELGLKDFVKREKEKFPEKTHKEIIIDMYKFHDRVRGRKS